MTHPTPSTNAAYQPLAGLPLMVWLSPAFPVGAFAYSHGLEWAAQAGRVPNAAALEAWLGDLLAHGAPRNDAILLTASWRAMRGGDHAALAACNDLALALAGSKERHLETSAQGTAFLIAIATSWPHPGITALTQALDWPHDQTIAYPVAVGLVAAAHDQDLGATLDAYLMALVGNLVSASIRLSVLGQTDGQRIIAGLLPRIRQLGADTADSTLDDVGGCAFMSDIAAMRHETQTTRLFRT
jgi:urease accessory protein